MKKTLAAAAVILSVTAAANATTPPPPPNTPSGRYLWRGDLFVISTEGVCTGIASVGDSHAVVFEPGSSNGWPYNASKDTLRHFWGLNATEWVPRNTNSLSGTDKVVNLTAISASGLQPTVPVPVDSFTVSNLPSPPKGSSTIAVGSTSVQITFTRTENAGACTFTRSGTLTGPF